MLKKTNFHKFDLTKGSPATAFVADSDVQRLIRFLNDPNIKEAKRIVRILQQMLELGSLEKPIWGNSEAERRFWSAPTAHAFMEKRNGILVPNRLLKRISPEKYAKQLEIEKRKMMLSRELAYYLFIPQAAPIDHGRWMVIWKTAPRVRQKLQRRLSVEINESQALQMILDFAKAGYLNRIRRCGLCNKWCYAKFRHQHFCSSKCQQKRYSQSEEWKAHRRDYMRRYYQQNLMRKG